MATRQDAGSRTNGRALDAFHAHVLHMVLEALRNALFDLRGVFLFPSNGICRCLDLTAHALSFSDGSALCFAFRFGLSSTRLNAELVHDDVFILRERLRDGGLERFRRFSRLGIDVILSGQALDGALSGANAFPNLLTNFRLLRFLQSLLQLGIIVELIHVAILTECSVENVSHFFARIGGSDLIDLIADLVSGIPNEVRRNALALRLSFFFRRGRRSGTNTLPYLSTCIPESIDDWLPILIGRGRVGIRTRTCRCSDFLTSRFSSFPSTISQIGSTISEFLGPIISTSQNAT